MRRHIIYITPLMSVQLRVLARKAGELLGRKVSCAALFRGALIPWIEEAERSPQRDTREKVRRAEPPYGSLAQRHTPAFTKELSVKLDRLRRKLGGKFSKYVAIGRSLLLLAALTPWLEAAERDLPAALEGIRAGIGKRGRKPER